MSDIPLTPEQSIFAAENHDLVIKYLKANQLPIDDYYDIVIFGYLKAVRDYFNRPDLRKYAFSTICWKAMKQSVSNHNKGTLRKKRNAEVIPSAALQAGHGKPEVYSPVQDHHCTAQNGC